MPAHYNYCCTIADITGKKFNYMLTSLRVQQYRVSIIKIIYTVLGLVSHLLL